MEKNVKIAFLAGKKAHWAAIECAKQITKDFYNIEPIRLLKYHSLKLLSTYIKDFYYCFKIPKYELYFTINTSSLFLAFLKKKLRREKCKIIHRVNDSIFSDFDINPIKKIFFKLIYSQIDGAIAVSEMIKKEILKKKSNLKVKVFSSPIKDNSFLNIIPNFKEKNIVCVSIAKRMRKGTDIQIKVQDSLKSKMFILGKKEYAKKLIKKNESKKNLFFTGWADPKIYFKKSLFFLHPARFDPSPNVILESMAAGLIPIVSYRTGRNELVSKIDQKLVVNSFDYKDYVNILRELINLNEKELKKLSKKSRNIAREEIKKSDIKKFKQTFYELIK